MTGKLTEAEIAKGLSTSPGWDRVGDMIVRSWTFAMPRRAREFALQVHELGERKGQEPDVLLKGRGVRVELSDHAVGGLTWNDFELAAEIEAIPADR